MLPTYSSYAATKGAIKQMTRHLAKELEQQITRAEDAASRLCPPVALSKREVRDRLDNPEDFERIQQTV